MQGLAPLDITFVEHSVGNDNALVFPPEAVDNQLVVVDDGIGILPVFFAHGHQERCVFDREGVEVTGIEPVDDCLQLRAEPIVIHGRGKNDHVCGTQFFVDWLHIVLLGAFAVMGDAVVAPEAPFDVFVFQKYFIDFVSGGFGAFDEGIGQDFGIAVFAGAAHQHNDFLIHNFFLVKESQYMSKLEKSLVCTFLTHTIQKESVKMAEERKCSEYDVNETPFSYTLSLIGGKWKMLILYCISEQKIVRYNELQRLIGNITYKTLSVQLKELEAAGLINRKEYPQIPPKVEYSLSEKGISLIPVLDAMCYWGSGNMPGRDEQS